MKQGLQENEQKPGSVRRRRKVEIRGERDKEREGKAETE